MKILVIDGQGGGIGKNIVEKLRSTLPNAEIIAAGTNSIATSNMLKAGADVGATGENAIIYNCAHSDIIVGPIGIILANAMLGEITPQMACAVADSDKKVVLIPMTKRHTPHIVGIEEKPMTYYIAEAIEVVESYFKP